MEKPSDEESIDPVSAEQGSREMQLELEAFINGVSTGLIGSFRLDWHGTLSVMPEELRGIGLVADPVALRKDGAIDLTRLPGVTYQYDEAAQAIRFTAGDKRRIARKLGIDAGEQTSLPVERGFGALANYTLTANFDTDDYWRLPDYSGVYGYFDTRFFTSHGTLDSSFSARSASEAGDQITRLDTAWRYSDPVNLRTYVAGDFISSGLAWTRPIRMSGVQLRRNFALRPDLVTIPVPELAGSAAVPSAVVVYVNGVRTYASDIPSGPFVVDDLPAVTGPGLAKVVVRDTRTGQETETEIAFYASSLLLRPGLADYAAEAGFARVDYGIESDVYGGDPVAIASLRYGLSDRITLEGHGEGGAGLVNGGLGFATVLGRLGVGSLAVAASSVDDDQGFLVSAAIEAAFGDWRLFARSQRTFGDYHDLASVTADGFDRKLHFFSALPPEALDQISLSIPLYLDETSLNLSFTHIKDEADESSILGLSYDRPLFAEATLFATAYVDVDDTDHAGIHAGISMQLGGNVSVGSGIERVGGQVSGFVDAIKPDRDEEGSVGWRVHGGLGDSANARANVSYVGRYTRLDAGAQNYGDRASFAAQMQGSLVAAGGDLFLARAIDDSFAIVDVGAPDVKVIAANRLVGKSGRSGKIIVPRLSPYEENRIAIDPENLPVDADIPETSRVIVPAEKTGVVVAFKARTESQSALVQFIDAEGRPLNAGLAGRLEPSQADFIVGYDGEAYLARLAAANSVTIERADGTQCHAKFKFQKKKGEQQLLTGVVCK